MRKTARCAIEWIAGQGCWANGIFWPHGKHVGGQKINRAAKTRGVDSDRRRGLLPEIPREGRGVRSRPAVACEARELAVFSPATGPIIIGAGRPMPFGP